MTDFYSRLLELRRAEGAARGLAKLPSDFYAQTRAFLADLKTTFESELRENPSGRKGELARQTHQRGLQLSRDIVEARTMKILTAALQASLGGSQELPNSLAEERTLHEALLSRLREHRREVAPYLDSRSGPSEGPGPSTPPARGSRTQSAGSAETAAPAGSASVRVVRMLRDSPRLALGSETVALRKDDLVSLPADVAQLLVESRAAEVIETPQAAARPKA